MTRPEPACWQQRGAASRRAVATDSPTRSTLRRRYAAVRRLTEQLLAPLFPDDFRIQSMPDVSPPYWNLGHTSWFFDRNVLQTAGRSPQGCHGLADGLDYALNSYYEGLGPRLPRERRGQVASPSTEVVRDYRRAVDDAMLDLIDTLDEGRLLELQPRIVIGCEHEQQHQELFLTEILHIRWSAPAALRRGYLEDARGPAPAPARPIDALRQVPFDAAETRLGHRKGDDDTFCWDNELPAHRVFVGDFALADRLVTNAEWQAFVDDGGYDDPLLWLSNGWHWRQQHSIDRPLYWHREGGGDWRRFTLLGDRPIDPNRPVCHVSFYEADAFARWYGEQHAAWRGARLPRECEWEHAARTSGFDTSGKNLLDQDPARTVFDVDAARADAGGLQQLCGTAWEWTASHYEAYPGYRPFDGALTEYNGKFMDNQRVLRGGSFATPRSQARVAYRNFWAPTTRFQATSVRLLIDR